MIDVSIQTDNISFEVKGMDKLWSLHSRLEIPLAHIKAAHVDPHPAMRWLQSLKVAGAELPNIFKAGTFYQDGGLVFWDVHHPDHTIVVDLDHERYQQLIIEVADPEMMAALINNAIPKART